MYVCGFNGFCGSNGGAADVQPKIASGGYHSLALKTDGTVWSWGRNNFGQLGDNTNTNRLLPVQVQGLSGVSAISAGYYHSLALKNDGTVWAWGYNSYGQLVITLIHIVVCLFKCRICLELVL